MAVNKGYKNTELGLIPNDWDVVELNTVSKIVRGGSPRPAGDPKYFGGTFMPWLTVASLTNVSESSILVTQTSGFLTKEGVQHSRTLESGTLILSNSGATLGVAKILDIQCCANDGIAAFQNVNKEIDKTYLCYFLNTKTKFFREVVATGNGQPNLNTRLIGKIKIAFPKTKEEQTKIAKALLDVDSLIESLTKLIAKKQDIKRGVMQSFILGDKRLPGHSKKRPKKKLGEICEIRKGQLITEKTCIPGSIPVIAGGKTPAYYHNEPNRLKKTITISGSGASAGYVAFHNYPIFASDCSTIEEGKNYSIEYIYFLLQLFQDEIYKMQTGGAQPHVHPSDLYPLEIPFPSIEEQYEFAEMLMDIDKEIDCLNKERNKIKIVKQGMMQELLTGKKRLV